jgi:TetR/AcrR family transcriptional regulator, mexJK operon transcriptional repressor
MDDEAPKSISRREERQQSRRNAILEVAARSFLEHGYAGTTMSRIAAELGGSKGTLWSYFASKELLFGAVIDRATLDFRRQLQVILNPEDDLATALHRFCAEFLNKITSSQAVALHRLVVAETARFPEVGRTFHERAPQAVQNVLASYLADAMNRGTLRRDDPRLAARNLAGLCMSGCHQLILLGVIEGPTPALVNADAERATAAFLRAYAAE